MDLQIIERECPHGVQSGRTSWMLIHLLTVMIDGQPSSVVIGKDPNHAAFLMDTLLRIHSEFIEDLRQNPLEGLPVSPETANTLLQRRSFDRRIMWCGEKQTSHSLGKNRLIGSSSAIDLRLRSSGIIGLWVLKIVINRTSLK